MDTRVSLQSIVQGAISDSGRLTDQLASLQAQASNGKRFQAISDDPANALTVLSNDTQAKIIDAHLNNISNAASDLNASVSTLQQAGDVLSQAHSLALEAASSINDGSTYETLAQQVDGLIDQLLHLANTQQQDGSYIYAGSATHTQPFVVTGSDAQGRPIAVQYQGSSDATQMFVDRGQQVAIDYAGNQTFGSAFTSLIALRDDLRNTSNLPQSDQVTAISADLAKLDDAHTNVLSTVGAQSATLQSLQSLQSHLQDLQLNARQTSSALGDVDMTELVVKLQAYQNMLQLSLATFSRVVGQNLLDFLH